MTHAATLDLAESFPIISVPPRQWKRVLVVIVAVLALFAFERAGGVTVMGHAIRAITGHTGGSATIRLSLDALRRVDTMTVDDKSQLLAEGASAQERNALIALTTLPLERVSAFNLTGLQDENSATALRCLTQAVYFEAATEPLQGRRAVAQVVLNRMRHPAYPKSVCGVVYQGSQRQTGCQFSFTCDGSLLRTPMTGPWREAQAVALDALNGRIEPSVGTATHYHADYVLPKWAFTLDKIEQLGRHIFYRFDGSWGRAPAFDGRYSGVEQIPLIDYSALRVRALEGNVASETLAAKSLVPGLTVTPEAFDRHTASDVGGRLDLTKEWRLTIPDPVESTQRYRRALGEAVPTAEHSHAAIAVSDLSEKIAVIEPRDQKAIP